MSHLDVPQSPANSSHQLGHGAPVGQEADLEYKLPATVQSMCEGWRSTFGSAATVSSLLAAVEASLVAFFKDDTKFKSSQSGVQKAILILTYATIILSISATISALTLTDQFGEIPSRASRVPGMNNTRTFVGEDWEVLLHFRTRKSTRVILYHWLMCLLVAGLCSISSITTYAVTQEGTLTVIVISIITVVATVPLLYLFFLPLLIRLGLLKD